MRGGSPPKFKLEAATADLNVAASPGRATCRSQRDWLGLRFTYR